MKNITGILIIIGVMIPGFIASQSAPDSAGRAGQAMCTVDGTRLGVSFFPRVQHPGVEYEAA